MLSYQPTVGQPHPLSRDHSLRITGVDLSQAVLVVDDEPMARTLLRLMLVRAGYEVFEAEDGYDALDKVKLHPPDVMILDVMMPGIDGFQVCEELRRQERTASMPIIMLSAKTDLDSVNRGLRAGATKYLTKPVSPEDLTQHVHEVLVPKQITTPS
ncbi:MAG: response regulator [Anaerolineae bacterium]|nr:response regulator [Anaerolineae bacterium]